MSQHIMDLPSEDQTLLCAFELDGKGGGRPITLDEYNQIPEASPVWVHLNRRGPETEAWLRNSLQLDKVFIDALLKEDARPRITQVGDNALIMFLRGINFNADATPDDMVSIRMLATPTRLITLRHRPIRAAQDLRRGFEEGHGVRDTSEAIYFICERLISRAIPMVDAIEAQLDETNELLNQNRPIDSGRLARNRKALNEMWRHLSPQKETLTKLANMEFDWLYPPRRYAWDEVANDSLFLVEELTMLREEAEITHERWEQSVAFSMNKAMYTLSIVAAIFLPLTLISGLLGVNLAGIPGSDHPWAFTILCVITAVIGLAQLAYFKWKHWF